GYGRVPGPGLGLVLENQSAQRLAPGVNAQVEDVANHDEAVVFGHKRIHWCFVLAIIHGDGGFEEVRKRGALGWPHRLRRGSRKVKSLMDRATDVLFCAVPQREEGGCARAA